MTYKIVSFWPKLRKSHIKHRLIQPGKVSEANPVPKNIKRPDYSAQRLRDAKSTSKINVKTEQEIQYMRESCKLASHALKFASSLLQDGISTDEIDKKLHNEIIRCGAYPSPLGYMGFPKSCCISINNVVCHGIPDDTIIREGDIVNIDIAVYYNGFHGDTSDTFAVGKVDETATRLIKATQESLQKGIECCKPGVSFSEIATRIEKVAIPNKFDICRNFVGHGIGKNFHELPDVYHYTDQPRQITDYKMKPGMTFTIEPIFLEGFYKNKQLSDGWTIVSKDNMRSAQSEHTILITETGFEILTKPN